MTHRRTAVVTGTTTGIGLELASKLASVGWNLALINRSRERTQPLMDRVRLESPEAVVSVYPADLSDQDQLRAAVADIAKEHNEVHALFNNAGVLRTTPGRSKHGHDLHFQVNVIAVWQLMHMLRPLLAATPQRAVVVNVSSSAIKSCGPLNVAGLSDPPKQGLFGAYGQSKLAVTVMTAMLAESFGADRIHLYAVDPGATRTAMTAGSGVPFFIRWARSLLPGPEKGAVKMMHPLDDSWADRNGSLIMSGKVARLPRAADTQAIRTQLREILEGCIPDLVPNQGAGSP